MTIIPLGMSISPIFESLLHILSVLKNSNFFLEPFREDDLLPPVYLVRREGNVQFVQQWGTPDPVLFLPGEVPSGSVWGGGYPLVLSLSNSGVSLGPVLSGVAPLCPVWGYPGPVLVLPGGTLAPV